MNVEQEFAAAQTLALQHGVTFTQVVDAEGNRILVAWRHYCVTLVTWQEAVIAARIFIANF